MRTESEVLLLRTTVQQRIDDMIKIGAPTYPSTPLERHGYELGRLAVLKWLNEPAAESIRKSGA